MALAPAVIVNLPGYPFENFPSLASIAALRALSSSRLLTGDNYVIDGASSAGDGGGGVFTWNDASTASDDGVSVIRPNDTGPGQAGRWIFVGASSFASLLELSRSTGSSLIGTTTGQTGAVDRTVADKLRDTLSLYDFGGINNGAVNSTIAFVNWLNAARTLGIRNLDGQGMTIGVTLASAFVTDLVIDNITLKELNPDVGNPQTVTFKAQVPSAGSLTLGPRFRVDRSGEGQASNIDNSWGIRVENVGRVQAYCEVFGNSKGTALWVMRANYFLFDGYIHDMLCDHAGAVDDIQQGVWNWLCEYVVTRGLVQRMGSLDRTSITRDRYSRGQVYSGCRNIDMGGSVGPGIDQSYDVTGDARNGNTNVRLNGAHSDYAFSAGFKFANAVLGVSSGGATAMEPGLCGVMVSGPEIGLVNSTRGAFISGVTQIGGGANQFWSPEAAVVRLNNQGMPGYPKNVRVAGNMWVGFGGPVSFTVADPNELALSDSAPLAAHTGARVRLTTTGTLPSPLLIDTDYYVVMNDNGNMQLATSFGRAQDGLVISGYSGGTGLNAINMQRDCNYGVLSEVTQYDKYAPNLVHNDNAFGPLIAKHINIKDLAATASASGAVSIPNNVATFMDIDAKDDPYGIVLSGGYAEIQFPFDALYVVHALVEWDAGTVAGVQSFGLRFGYNGGLNELTGYTQRQKCDNQVSTQVIQWTGRALFDQRMRFEVAQSSGSAKNCRLREIYVAYQP